MLPKFLTGSSTDLSSSRLFLKLREYTGGVTSGMWHSKFIPSLKREKLGIIISYRIVKSGCAERVHGRPRLKVMQTESPDWVINDLILAFSSFEAAGMGEAFARRVGGADAGFSWWGSVSTGGTCVQQSVDSLHLCWWICMMTCRVIIVGQIGRSMTAEWWTAQMRVATDMWAGKFYQTAGAIHAPPENPSTLQVHNPSALLCALEP